MSHLTSSQQAILDEVRSGRTTPYDSRNAADDADIQILLGRNLVSVYREDEVVFVYPNDPSPSVLPDQHRVALTGLTVDYLRWSTSWGDGTCPPVDQSARAKVLAATTRKVGRGTQSRCALTSAEVTSLFTILDSYARLGESMTAEERGDDASTFRAVRRDAARLDVILDMDVD